MDFLFAKCLSQSARQHFGIISICLAEYFGARLRLREEILIFVKMRWTVMWEIPNFRPNRLVDWPTLFLVLDSKLFVLLTSNFLVFYHLEILLKHEK